MKTPNNQEEKLIRALFEYTNSYKTNNIFAISHEGKKYKCSLQKIKKTRSLPQNKLYWAWLSFLSEHISGDKRALTEELHERFKRKYLKWEKKNLKGFRDVYLPGSTKGLDTKEFTQYLDNIRAFVMDFFRINLPNPNDKHWEEFIEQYAYRY